MPLRDFISSETRFAVLERTKPARAAELAALAQADVDERWRYYTQLAQVHRTIPHADHGGGDPPSDVAQDVESDAGYRHEEER